MLSFLQKWCKLQWFKKWEWNMIERRQYWVLPFFWCKKHNATKCNRHSYAIQLSIFKCWLSRCFAKQFQMSVKKLEEKGCLLGVWVVKLLFKRQTCAEQNEQKAARKYQHILWCDYSAMLIGPIKITSKLPFMSNRYCHWQTANGIQGKNPDHCQDYGYCFVQWKLYSLPC